jgi:hypothetical protein
LKIIKTCLISLSAQGNRGKQFDINNDLLIEYLLTLLLLMPFTIPFSINNGVIPLEDIIFLDIDNNAAISLVIRNSNISPISIILSKKTSQSLHVLIDVIVSLSVIKSSLYNLSLVLVKYY